MVMYMVTSILTIRIKKMKSVEKIYDMILSPASIISRETYELQKINKDEKEKTKIVGGRKTPRNDKRNANKT